MPSLTSSEKFHQIISPGKVTYRIDGVIYSIVFFLPFNLNNQMHKYLEEKHHKK